MQYKQFLKECAVVPNKGNLMLKYYFLVIILLLTAACSNGRGASVESANELYQSGEISAAIIELKKVLKASPENADARFLLGEIYLESGDSSGAIKELASARKYGSPNQRLPLLMARSFLMSGKVDKALQTAVVIDSMPLTLKVETLIMRASAFANKSDFRKAEKILASAELLDNKNINLLLVKARISLSRNDFTEVNQYLDELNVLSPGNIDGELIRGLLSVNQGQYKNAVIQFENVIASLSKSRFGKQELSAHVGKIQSLLAVSATVEAEKAVHIFTSRLPNHPLPLYFSAVINYEKQDYSKAKDELQAVLVKIPNHYPSLLLLGAVNFASKNFEQANKYLTKYVDRVPSHIYARKLLGVTRLRLDRPDDALTILKKGMEDEEVDAGLLALIGRVVMRTDINLAASYYEKATAQKPENVELRKQLAKVYIASGQLDKAIQTLDFLGGESALQAEALKVYASLEEKNYKKARLLSSDLIKKHPSDPRFYLIRASVEISTGYKLAAENFLLKALEIKNDFIPAMIALAKLKVQSGLLADAKKLYERAESIKPNNLQASLGLAEISERQGLPKVAVKILKKAVQQHPNQQAPQVILAGYYLQKGRAKDANKLLTGIAKGNANLDVWQMLGRSQEALKNWGAAQRSYKKVLKIAPNSSVTYVSLARVSANAGELDEAKGYLEAALKSNPDFSSAHTGLADLAILAGEFTKAAKIGRSLVKTNPTSPSGNMVLADVAFAQKSYQASKQYYIKAFRLKPNRRALLKAFSSFQRAGEIAIVRDLLSAWLRSFPSDTATRLMLATKYQENNDGVAAEKEYRLLLKSQPDNSVVLNNLALLRLAEAPSEAVLLAAQAYRQNENNAAIMDTYGWVLTQTGDYREGLEILERAANESSHPDIQYHLAFALVKSEKVVRAKSILSVILAGNPKFSERKAAQQLLATL